MISNLLDNKKLIVLFITILTIMIIPAFVLAGKGGRGGRGGMGGMGEMEWVDQVIIHTIRDTAGSLLIIRVPHTHIILELHMDMEAMPHPMLIVVTPHPILIVAMPHPILIAVLGGTAMDIPALILVIAAHITVAMVMAVYGNYPRIIF